MLRKGLAVLAVMLLAATARADGVSVEQATDEQKSAAQRSYTTGRDAYNERQFVDALAAFRASYDIVASPNTHLMIAHTLRELGRHAEGYAELVLVLEQAEAAAVRDPKYKDSVQLAVEELALMRKLVGLVKLEIAEPDRVATVTVAGREVERSRWGAPVPVDPGKATFVLTRTDGSSVVREVAVEADGEKALRLDAEKEQPAGPVTLPRDTSDGGDAAPASFSWDTPQRIAAYAIVGAGVLSFGAAGVLGVLAQTTHADLEEACGLAPCPERQDDIDRGRTFQTVSNVLLIAGGALVAGGVVVFFTAPDESASHSAQAWSLMLGPGNVALETRF